MKILIKKIKSIFRKNPNWKKVTNPIPMGFWKDLKDRKEPFFCLAPMADVTDRVFRKIVAKYSRHGQEGGGPDVFWTEFVSADGLMSEGYDKLVIDLYKNENESPIVAQIFGTDLEKLKKTAELCVELGYDGIDINFGCPEKNVCKSGGGCGAIQNPEHSIKVVQAVQDGAAGRIPVSVKTRLGFNVEEIETWIPTMLELGLAALTIHFRTRKEMSKVPARWDRMKRIREIRNVISPETVLIGNGDIETLEHGRKLAKKNGAEGVMIGRGIFGNPWFFDSKNPEVTTEEKLLVMLEHTKLYVEELPMKNFQIMKKHYKAYVNNFEGAKELRTNLMLCNSYEEIENLTKKFLNK